MAQPAGTVEAGTYYYEVVDSPGYSDRHYMYFILPIPWMPAYWTEDDKDDKFIRYMIDRCIRVSDTTAGLTENYMVETSDVQVQIVTAGVVPDTSAWDGETEMEQYPNQTRMFDRFPMGPSHSKPRYAIITLQMIGTVESGDHVYVHAINFRGIFDRNYNAGPDGADGTVEITPRDVSAGVWEQLYGPDFPCSAWHMMEVLCDTMRKIMYNNVPVLCYPTFGAPEFVIP